MNWGAVTTVVPWFLCAICGVSIAVFSYFSFTNDHLVLETFCRSPTVDVFLNDSTGTLISFEEWAENITDRLSIVISVNSYLDHPPEAFTAVLQRALNRGVHVRLYTNHENVTGPKGTHVKRFPRTEKFMVNLAVGDLEKVFVPSSFFQTSTSPMITHVLRFDNCSSAGQEATNIFEMIWDTPRGDRKTAVKQRWIVRKGYYGNHNGVNFLFGPTTLYPMNRTTTCAVNVSLLLGDLAMERTVVSSTLYPSRVRGINGALDASIVTGMFEQMDSFQSKKATVFTMREHLVTNKEQVRSLLVNMAVAPRNNLYQCRNLEIDGTVAYTDNLGYILMPCGIGDIYDEDQVLLGVASNNKTNILSKITGPLRNLYCKDVATPDITQPV